VSEANWSSLREGTGNAEGRWEAQVVAVRTWLKGERVDCKRHEFCAQETEVAWDRQGVYNGGEKGFNSRNDSLKNRRSSILTPTEKNLEVGN